eukprot:363637-Chlamydomonas_euryale.AAC.14
MAAKGTSALPTACLPVHPHSAARTSHAEVEALQLHRASRPQRSKAASHSPVLLSPLPQRLHPARLQAWSALRAPPNWHCCCCVRRQAMHYGWRPAAGPRPGLEASGIWRLQVWLPIRQIPARPGQRLAPPDPWELHVSEKMPSLQARQRQPSQRASAPQPSTGCPAWKRTTADSCSKARHSCPPTSRHPPSSASATCTARSTRPCARSTCAPPVAAPCGVPLPLVGGGIPLEGTGAVLVLVGVLSGEGDGERKGAPGPGSSRASAGSLQTESAVPYGAGGVANEAMLTSQRQVCAQMASNAAAAMHTPLHTAHALLRHSGLMATRNPDGSISSSA